MQPLELVLLLVAAAAILGMLARWLRWPYPILLVIGGLLISLQPGAPRLVLDPQYVFLLFLPPLLYAGAFHTDWPEFKANIRSIALLAVGLTLFTTLAVAAAAHYYCDLAWPVAFVLGAIVSPPDAVAAMSITQLVKVPKVVATLIDGEGLVNDAAALVAYRVALASVMLGTFSLGQASQDFLIASFGGIALGIAAGWFIIRMHNWIERNDLADSKLTITITLLTPFAIYVPAEHLRLSGVLAVVVAGLWVSTRVEDILSIELHAEANAVWTWVEFLLNSLIFILIGFQLPDVLEGLEAYSFEQLVRYAAIISAVVIITRILWVFPGAYLPRWLDRKLLGKPAPYPPWQSVAVVAWTGMRGVVSLAAAMALPMKLEDGSPFPHRDLIEFLTFWVIFATLVGQGLSLPLVIRLLGVDRRADAEPAAEENAVS